MPPRTTIPNKLFRFYTDDIEIQQWHWYAMITPVCSLFFLTTDWEKYCAAIYFAYNVHFKSIKSWTVCAYNLSRICFTMFIFLYLKMRLELLNWTQRTLDAFTYTCLNACLFIHVWMCTYSCMFECALILGLIHVWMRLSRTQRDPGCLHSYVYESRHFPQILTMGTPELAREGEMWGIFCELKHYL